jgi:hypothetical protein
MEKLREIIKEKTYSEQLEEKIRAGRIVDMLVDEFDRFVAERKITNEGEHATLNKIKIFLHKNQERVGDICKDSLLDQWGCLSLVTLAAMMAGRKGYQVAIGKPKNLSERYINTVLIENGGQIFQMVRSPLDSTEFEKMNVRDVYYRFMRYRPLTKIGRGSCEKLDEVYPDELERVLRKTMDKPTRSQ